MIANLLLLRGNPVAPAPERVRFAGTAMCKAIAPWELRSTRSPDFLERLVECSSSIRRVRRSGYDRRNRSDAGRSGQGFFAMGGKLCGLDSRYGYDVEGAALVRTDRARGDEIQSQSRRAWPSSADAALLGTDGNRYPVVRRARYHRRRLDEHGAHFRGHQRACVRASAVRTDDRCSPCVRSPAPRFDPWLQFAGDIVCCAKRSRRSSMTSRTSMRRSNTPADSDWTTRPHDAFGAPRPEKRSSTLMRSHATPQSIAQRRRDSTTQSSSRSQPYGLTINTTTTIYGMDDRYRGVYGQRRVIFHQHGRLAKHRHARRRTRRHHSCYGDGTAASRGGFSLGRIQHPTRLHRRLLPGDQTRWLHCQALRSRRAHPLRNPFRCFSRVAIRRWCVTNETRTHRVAQNS